MQPDDPAAVPPPTTASPPTRAPDAFREGQYLVVRKRGAKLPPGCVLCNGPEAKRIWLKVRKFNLPVGGLILALLSFVLLTMYLVAPMAQFEAGLCSSHVDDIRRRRRPRLKFLWVVLAMLVLGIAVSFCGPTLGIIGGILAAVSVLLLPIAILIAFSPRPVLTAHYSDRRYLWVAGLSPEYLRQFQEIGGES